MHVTRRDNATFEHRGASAHFPVTDPIPSITGFLKSLSSMLVLDFNEGIGRGGYRPAPNRYMNQTQARPPCE